MAALTLALTACGGGGDAGAAPVSAGGAGSSDTTSGAAFTAPSDVDTVTLDANAAITENDGSIDVSRVDDGVVLAEATSAAKLKFVVMAGEMTYAYDLPSDGTPITCPINMGDGEYSFRVMQNTSGQNYVEIVKWDTLHVYHTDTMKIIHNDTVYSVKVETKHDSIIIKEKYYLDADGNVTLTEKEKESYHNNEKDSQFIQHTVDSLVRAKVDSIYQSKHEDKPVLVEKQKTWWENFTDAVRNDFAWIGFIILIGGIILFAWKTK